MGLRYDYYRVEVPGDCADSIRELGAIAITEARERARVYAMPCDWTATHVSGDVGDFVVRFQVRRRRHGGRPTVRRESV